MPMLRKSIVATSFVIGAATSGCSMVSHQTTVAIQAAAGSGGPGASAMTQGPPVRTTAAPTGELLPLEKWSVVLVTAKSVPRLGEVREMSNEFTYEGRVFAHATFSAPEGSHAGQPTVEVRWSNDDRLVSVQRAQPLVNKSPYYMASSTSGTALGVGKGRVEYAVNGTVVASKEFSVTER